ncbi:SCO0930 family lipoprotein [Streptomyces apocyni]|uniref:SCO0930 family lipoprotein n=1 Tax=Streptomyces apocyni TaxID=2654677 RepID=UPI0012EB04FC|nr:SCO0930 family lipoprotein [Streptomyces apocyni]
MNTWRSASMAVAAAAVLTLTAACGQDQGSDSPKGSVGNAVPAEGGYGAGGSYGDGADANAEGGAAEAKSAGQLAVWDSKKLGKVVTDSAGLTLYRFDKDTAEPPKSNCEGDCAKAWPVVAADDVKAPPGVDVALIGSVERADGTEQLTIAGWPMYRYAQDKKAGDAKGQGVGGTWYAAAPDGKKAAAGAADGGGGGEGDDAGGDYGDGGDAGGDQPEAGDVADLPGMSTREDPKLGEIVVDKNGMTVYRFTKDSAWPMKTACTGECLEKWPAVKPVEANDTKGIELKGSSGNRGFVVFDRPDGIKQQTIDCWPLYTFAADKKPGDTNGQGVGGSWYAVSPEGKLVGAPKS